MTARSFAFLVVLLGVVFGSFSACKGPARNFVSPDDDGGAPGTGGTAGTAGDAGTCFLGEERCDFLVPMRCTETGAWVPSRASCAVACLAGQCVSCVEDTTMCRDGAVQRCVGGVWTTGNVCPRACEVDACVDACTEGRYQCNGERSLQRCVMGAFVDDTECPFSCIDDECTGECVRDTRRCNPDAPNESQACNAQGNWDASTPCGTGTFCVAGDCKPCAPDTTRCSVSGPQLCSETGEWVNQGSCTGSTTACFEGRCVPCTPGEKRCGAGVIEECLADGSGWDVDETCSGDTPACIDATKTCGRCTDGETQCLDDAVQTCDDQGVFQTTETCTGSTPQCFDDECTECDPDAGERRCASSNSTQACNPDGTWATADPCTGDTPECREDLDFSCGCEENTRRCRANTTTVPERCQGGAWVAQTACSGTLNHCLPETGLCVDCAPGTAECRNGVAHQCNSAGAFESLNSCAGPGINCGNCGVGDTCTQGSQCGTGICVTGRCAVCQPGTRDCLGTTPRLCSNDGAWTNQTACSGNTPVCLSSTGMCVACSNGSSRNCGNCNTGTQTCSNNTWGTCTGAVDLMTSEQHCGTCNNACSSSQICQSGVCGCASGSHACSGSTTCYSNTDGTHCGPSCFSCGTYAGTTGACSSNQCTCEASTTLACGANVPTCGNWDFNSSTVEGWRFGDWGQPSDHHWVGSLGTMVTNGSPALYARFDGTQSQGGYVEFEVDLCPNGAILNLSDRVLTFDFYFLTSGGSRFSPDPMDATDSVLVSDRSVLTGCQPFVEPGSDEWLRGTCANLPASMTNLTIVFRIRTGWAGSVFLDNVRFAPP